MGIARKRREDKEISAKADEKLDFCIVHNAKDKCRIVRVDREIVANASCEVCGSNALFSTYVCVYTAKHNTFAFLEPFKDRCDSCQFVVQLARDIRNKRSQTKK